MEQRGDTDGGLDVALERIGVGMYQKKLLILCGFGWMSDNLWLQSIAACLPRVQAHFGISDREIGILPSSMFTGMMLGAWIWGSFSDSYGRVPAFNGTLALAAVFGGLAGFAPSFSWLCVAFFFLGIGVGGSMPTDGTLFLENVAVRHHYLLTALSVFFSIGAVLASVFAILILPSRSCPTPITEACNLEVDNIGWRILLQASACATLIMFFSRFFLFKLHESPSWLVAEGRETDAAIILEKIAKSNGTEMSFRAEDIAADKPEEATAMLSRNEGDGDVEDQADVKAVRPLLTGLPVSVQTSVSDYMERLDKLFTAPWRRTTVLVWLIWALFSAAFTIFNAFLPSWLERKAAVQEDADLTESLQEFLLFTIAGLPGAFLGAWLVETPLGRRKAMALSTTVTLSGILLFTQISSKAAIVLSSSIVNLGSTISYAIIYSYTPETFTADVRGTASGIASALSRATSIAAPLLSGVLLSVSQNSPLYFSALVFSVAAVCMLSLPFEKGSLR